MKPHRKKTIKASVPTRVNLKMNRKKETKKVINENKNFVVLLTPKE